MHAGPIDLHHQGNARAIGVYLLETADGPALLDCGPSSTLPALKTALDNLDATPNNVTLTTTDDGFTVDMNVVQTVTDTTDLSLGTGSVALTSSLPPS